MLKRIIHKTCTPEIKKLFNGKDASHRGAFPCGGTLEFVLRVPRSLGASAVVLRIGEDGCDDMDAPLRFDGTLDGIDTYGISIDTGALCKNGTDGLFFYEFLFLRGPDTLFTDTHNFVDFELNDRSSGRFLLLIHKADFSTPEWFRGGIMYHIFVDRFCKGQGEVGTRDDALMNDDWDNGIVQFPERAGQAYSNNMFFGGNLWGVAEKLEYLSSLSVSVIYLSPIFKAYSNHKYDTGNYFEVDSMFGGDAAFEHLLREAEKYSVKIILDGVFNHTGDDSLYFDKYGKYGGIGAYSNPESVFRGWYRFHTYPDRYDSWWGIDILPRLDHSNAECRRFFTGDGGVADKYVKMGIGGWRLDVADELSDEFLDELRVTVKRASGGQALILGEVWENAAEKIAYSRRRRYLRGDQLDSVMNYPLRNGVLALLLHKDAEFLADILKSIYASYPKCVCDSLMNLLGTHDTERILTVLGDTEFADADIPNAELAVRRLDSAHKARAKQALRIAATVQYTVFGVPSVFYGDEAGVQGYHDPFCRATYPWGREDAELVSFYTLLGKIRREHKVFSEGDFRVEYAHGGVIVYSRSSDDERIYVAVNVQDTAVQYGLGEGFFDLVTECEYGGVIEPMRAYVLKKEK